MSASDKMIRFPRKRRKSSESPKNTCYQEKSRFRIYLCFLEKCEENADKETSQEVYQQSSIRKS